jgi:hypothetical protein
LFLQWAANDEALVKKEDVAREEQLARQELRATMIGSVPSIVPGTAPPAAQKEASVARACAEKVTALQNDLHSQHARLKGMQESLAPGTDLSTLDPAVNTAMGAAQVAVTRLTTELGEAQRQERVAASALAEARAAVERGASWEQVHVLDRRKMDHAHARVCSDKAFQYDAMRGVSDGVQVLSRTMLETSSRYSDRRRSKGAHALFRLLQSHKESGSRDAVAASGDPAGSAGSRVRRLTRLVWGKDCKSALQEEVRAEADASLSWLEREEGRCAAELAVYDSQRKNAVGRGKKPKKGATPPEPDGPVSATLGAGSSEVKWWDKDNAREKEGALGWAELGLAQVRWDVARSAQAGPFSDTKKVHPRLCSRVTRTGTGTSDGDVRISRRLAMACLDLVASSSQKYGQEGAHPAFAAAGYPLPLPGPDVISHRDLRNVLELNVSLTSQASSKFSVGACLSHT